MTSSSTNSVARTLETAGSRQYLVFLASHAELAVALERVSEILPYEKVAYVPGTPAYVRGVVHVRGRVVPVVDLSVKLGRQPQESGKRTCIVMLDVGRDGDELPMGIVADQVATLLEVDLSKLSSPPRFGGNVEVTFLEGMYPTARGMLPIIDVSKLFASSELLDLSSLAQGATRE